MKSMLSRNTIQPSMVFIHPSFSFKHTLRIVSTTKAKVDNRLEVLNSTRLRSDVSNILTMSSTVGTSPLPYSLQEHRDRLRNQIIK